MPPTYYQYPSDDGTTYQVAVDTNYSQPVLGDLVVADGSEPIFWATRAPRVFIAAGNIGGFPLHIPVVCTPTNAYYLSGPGTPITVGDLELQVTACYGETLRWQPTPESN